GERKVVAVFSAAGGAAWQSTPAVFAGSGRTAPGGLAAIWFAGETAMAGDTAAAARSATGATMLTTAAEGGDSIPAPVVVRSVDPVTAGGGNVRLSEPLLLPRSPLPNG